MLHWHIAEFPDSFLVAPSQSAMSSKAEFCRLVLDAQGGDRPAIERLMLMYRSTVSSETNKFVGSLKSDVSVQDLEQETWIRVWSRLPGFTGAEDEDTCKKMFASWLKTTTRRVALGIIEAGQAQKRGGETQALTLEEPVRDTNKSPSSVARSDERRTQLLDALKEIDGEDAADLVRLHYLEGLPVAEVAERMGLTENQVRYRIKLALKSLGQRLDHD